MERICETGGRTAIALGFVQNASMDDHQIPFMYQPDEPVKNQGHKRNAAADLVHKFREYIFPRLWGVVDL